LRLSGGAPFEIRRGVIIEGPQNVKEPFNEALRNVRKVSEGNPISLRPGRSWDRLPANGYKLSITADAIEVTYADAAGAFYAAQTLHQLVTDGASTIPQMEIVDWPRFSWRGSLLDVSRHFFSSTFIKRYIDYLAMHKMNVFHWHLVDDGGWRMQVDKYPRLTEIGAWRTETGEVWPGGAWNMGNLEFPGKKSGKKLYGGFYTKRDIREIVEYAAKRQVTIVPEIEMPGHSLPACVAHPELSCENASASGLPRTNVYCVGNDATLKFLEDVLDETIDLFPSKFIHIGADEVWKGFWKNCPRCQARMKAEGLQSEEELQSWFVKRMERYLAAKGRRLIGWDEILEGGLAPGAAVMSWRGISGGIEAAKSGHDVAMSPTSHCYFDYPYSSTSTMHVYSYEPVPAELSESDSKRVMGAQFNVWTEWIPSEERVEQMIFPRMLALAECVWTNPKRKDFVDFSRRLTQYYGRLDKLGATYYIEAPTLDSTALLFAESGEVSAPIVKSPFTLRYTLDGSIPTGKSPAYTRPIRVSKDCTVSLAYVSSKGNTGDVARVECRKALPIAVTADMVAGLHGAAYTGAFRAMPDFSQIGPAKAFDAGVVDESQAPSAENYALRFSGFFEARVDGVYAFDLGSDDGSKMLLAGATIIDNDGLHAFSEKTGSVTLRKGLYPIEVQFFQAGGAHKLSLFVTPPGGQRDVAKEFWRQPKKELSRRSRRQAP
jgi:hexosaminidase